jgi:uncharacterized phage protein (TIGR02220 family)
MIDSFIIYTNYIEKLQGLNDAQLGTLFRAILEYEYSELKEMPDIQDEAAKVAFYFIKSDLDNNYKKYIETCNKRKENLKKANASKESANATQMQSECTPSAVQMGSDNDNEYDNDNKKENIKEKRNEDISSVVSYLNDHASTHYRLSSRNTRSHINARFEDGYTVEDFKQVIDTKCDEWLGTDMAKYLRPDTLFGTKFESYLNQKPRAKPQAPNYSIDNSNLGITEEDIERYLK